MTRAKKKPARGFALVIVAVCGIAMTSIALALVYTAGSQRILSTKGAATDRATTIADSGMERAIAYLDAVAQVEGDFDAVLDPGLDHDCIADRNVRAEGLPRYADGATATDADGTEYVRVVFNGGAYYTRVEDDVDDLTDSSTLFALFTGNNDNGGLCPEGLGMLDSGVRHNNPHRDRNRAVWVTVIGVYPETDLGTAKQRVTLRRYYTSPEPSPLPVMFVGGDLNIAASATLEFCSDQGYIAVWGNLGATGDLEHCGSVAVNGTVSGTGADPSCGSVGCTPRGTISAGASMPLPPAGSVTVTTENWVDPGDSCNFLVVDAPANARGIYYWDAAGTRVSGPCSNFNPLVTPPVTNTADFSAAAGAKTFVGSSGKSCWLPLLLVDDTNTVQAGIDNDELCGTGWCPVEGDASASRGFGGSAFSATGSVWNGIEFSTAITKPDFGTCDGVDVAFRPGGGSETCAGSCDGTEAVLSWTGSWQFQDNFAAYPVGMYRLLGATTLNMATPTVPADDATPAQWPLITLITTGDLDINADAVLGVGSASTPGGTAATNRDPLGGLVRFPSLLVGGDLRLGGGGVDVVLGGGLFVEGELRLASNATLTVYGPVAVKGDVATTATSRIEVRHDDPFAADVGQQPIITSASTSKTVR